MEYNVAKTIETPFGNKTTVIGTIPDDWNIDRWIHNYNQNEGNVPKHYLHTVPDNEVKAYHSELKLNSQQRLVFEVDVGIYYSILEIAGKE